MYVVSKRTISLSVLNTASTCFWTGWERRPPTASCNTSWSDSFYWNQYFWKQFSCSANDKSRKKCISLYVENANDFVYSSQPFNRMKPLFIKYSKYLTREPSYKYETFSAIFTISCISFCSGWIISNGHLSEQQLLTWSAILLVTLFCFSVSFLFSSVRAHHDPNSFTKSTFLGTITPFTPWVACPR